MIRKILNNILVAYVFVSYYLMFSILYQNKEHKDACKRNMLELMTAAAPITISYLVVKNAVDGESCKKGTIRITL